MMRVVREYEVASGQMINLDKSLFYLHEEALVRVCNRIKRLTDITQRNFPFIYLGCPMFYGRKNKSHFKDLLKKMIKRLSLWQNKLLSFGARYILITHVLQSIPVYLLSAINSLIGVIEQLHRILAKFFWANATRSRNKHWVSWENICYPKEESEIGLRSLQVMSNALFAKLWWKFRTSTSSMWGEFMWNKYCKKLHPILARGCGASHVRRKMQTKEKEQLKRNWKSGSFPGVEHGIDIS
ncbi:hypothetical protein KY289_008275 [Solanum tuberosum]|nr:hypothetical protein KY289_008275 [Solanum tuberosum]